MTDSDWREATDKLPQVGQAAHVVKRNPSVSDMPAVQLSAVSQVMSITQQGQQAALLSPDSSRSKRVRISSQVTGSGMTGFTLCCDRDCSWGRGTACKEDASMGRVSVALCCDGTIAWPSLEIYFLVSDLVNASAPSSFNCLGRSGNRSIRTDCQCLPMAMPLTR